MAALLDHIPFAPIFREDNILSVSASSSTECVTVSSISRTISTIKISDQKLLSSWSLRHGVELTSPVVWDVGSEKYLTVCNHQDIKVWEKGCTDLDKVKRKHAREIIQKSSTLDSGKFVDCIQTFGPLTAVRIHQLLTVPGCEPVILCQNGSVNFLSNYKQLPDSGPVKESEDIVWCTAANVGDELVVAMVTNSKTGKTIHCNFYSDDSWKTDARIINPPADDVVLCSCDSLVCNDTFKIFLLWSNGDIATVDVTERSVSPPQVQQTFSGIHSNCCMVVIDTTHVAVAGVANKDEEGIAIFDLKFGVLDTWKSYPNNLTQKPKLFYVAGHLFLPCQTMLYMYKVNCQPSTVAGLLGQTSLSSEPANIHSHYRWTAGRKRDSSPQKSSDLTTLFNATLRDKLEACEILQSYPKFKEAYENLMTALGKPENSHWLTSSHMIQLIQRCLAEKKFWPSSELKQLIDRKCVPPGLMSETLDALIQHSDIALVDNIISTQTDIPEKCLCSALSFYFEYEDEKLSGALDYLPGDRDSPVTMVTDSDTGQDDCSNPLSAQKSFLIDKVLLSPYSDVFLLECLKDISFKHALKLLEYLCYLLSSNVSNKQLETSKTTLQLSEVVDWLCLILDSHMTQFVLSPDAHVTMIKLHCVVSNQVQFYDDLLSLEAILDQLKARSELKQDKKIGHYCIEVLHIP